MSRETGLEESSPFQLLYSSPKKCHLLNHRQERSDSFSKTMERTSSASTQRSFHFLRLYQHSPEPNFHLFFFFFDVDPPSGTGLTAYLPRSCWQDWRALTVAAPSPPKAMLRSSMVSVPSLRRTRMPAFTWAQALCWHCACRKADTNSPCGGKCRRELLHVSTSEHGFCFSVPLINHLDPTERDTKDTWHHLRATWLPSPSN